MEKPRNERTAYSYTMCTTTEKRGATYANSQKNRS